MSDFVMPSLGADMESGTLLEWRIKPGDPVRRGDIVALVDTSKAEIEVEIFEDGVIDDLLVGEGTRVPVGTVLATVRPAGAEPATAPPAAAEPAAATPSVAAREPAAAAQPIAAREPVAAAEPGAGRPLVTAGRPVAAPEAVTAPARVVDDHRLRVSPLARRVAERLGVDLSAVSGTGPNGAVTKADVERASAQAPGPVITLPTAPAATPASGARHPAMREAIGALMARSKREIPHYYVQLDINFSPALGWLHETNLSRPVNERLLPAALLLCAVARAVTEMPEMNGFWVDGGFHPGAGVHLGVAISLRGGGLIAPALHHADRKSPAEIMEGMRDLTQRARAGRLRSSEMSDPTITVTNLGEHGVDLVHGVIYPPQVALVGFGAARERPWAVGGLLGVRSIVTATLAADHRATDGHTGSRFLARINAHLQTPESL